MFRRNDASSATSGSLSINTSEPSCELFKPQDRVYWCSSKACNECGIIETRVGTSCGDPSTASYLITKLNDGSKIEIPGYLLRRSAKYHAYHTRNRSTLSTCSSHTPGSSCKATNKIPHERKRRRHASGHPTMQSDTIAKSLGNDNSVSKNSSQIRILSPPETQGFGIVNGTSNSNQLSNNDCECVIRRSNSGMPPLPQGVQLSFMIPDADSEEVGPLSTSPSADEGVDLSDAMFSFDDDVVQSPPKSCSNSAHATFTIGGCHLHDQQSMGAAPSYPPRGTSDEDTPRTPVAIATYQQAMAGGGSVSSCSYSYSTGANCVTTQQRLTATTNQHSVGAEAAMTDHSSEALSGGGYFTRSQATRQAKGGGDLGANVWLADPPESRWGRLNNVCRPETSTATTGSAGREAAVSRGSSRSVTQSVENSCGASDEGVVDLEACGGTVLLGANLNCEGQANDLSSPNSCCAADVSEDFSDCEGEVDHEELNEDVYQDACEHPQLVLRQVGHSTSIPGHLGASRNMTDGEMATVSSDDCGSQTVTRDSKKSSKMRKSATGGISDTSVVLRTAGGDSVLVRKDSRSSENSGFPSGSAEGSSGSVNSIHSHGSAASASLDQLTNSIAKLKTKLSSPCNTIVSLLLGQ
ncbi:uncharacterized protein LOC142336712 [Convolutriloba macropyga]|uniref:uncharacterized protein LOC142336712 n=1 Tax=Convolutriloba macropyga TaxID=536237 RepID=UPI003F525B52